MTCWEILGLSPTNNRERIEKAYASQRKFASGDDLARLNEAYNEALREAGFSVPEPSHPVAESTPVAPATPETPAALNARDQQVVREVVIQIQAMLNDNYRLNDAGVWRAILTEPPADRDHIREAVSDALHPQLKPLLSDGRLPEPVLAFLAQWFGWPELDTADQGESEQSSDPFDNPIHRGPSASPESEQPGSEQRQPVTSFLPAAIGWIAGLVILTSIFSQLLGH